jgi:TetR/AcrR family transcriptional regulator, transcriptional repressor for nem operon
MNKIAPEIAGYNFGARTIGRSPVNTVFEKAKGKFRSTPEEAVSAGATAPMNTEYTATATQAFLEGIILLAKARNEPEVILRLRPAIKTLRIELDPSLHLGEPTQ